MTAINNLNSNFDSNSSVVFIDSNIDNYQTLIAGSESRQRSSARLS